MNHFELCKKTAEWCIKYNHIAFYEYQSTATSEFPDVLSFKNKTSRLYEIKVSKQDFLKDCKKDSRKGLTSYTVKHKPRKYKQWDFDTNGNRVHITKYMYGFEESYRQMPHIGVFRYYVCPYGLIEPEEVKLFGLYWYREKDGKFFKKKESVKFRRCMHQENNLLVHAIRRLKNTGSCNLITKEY